MQLVWLRYLKGQVDKVCRTYYWCWKPIHSSKLMQITSALLFGDKEDQILWNIPECQSGGWHYQMIGDQILTFLHYISLKLSWLIKNGCPSLPSCINSSSAIILVSSDEVHFVEHSSIHVSWLPLRLEVDLTEPNKKHSRACCHGMAQEISLKHNYRHSRRIVDSQECSLIILPMLATCH